MFLLLYADDIVLISDTAQGLQKGLDLLSDYCSRWRMIINKLKTKVLVFHESGSLPRNLKFYLENTELEIVKKFSYLGIVLTSGGSFANATQTLAGQAKKGLFKMTKMTDNFLGLTPKNYFDLLDTLIIPILSYGCEVWGLFAADVIEKVQLRYVFWVLHFISTPNNFVYGDTGRLPLLIFRQYRVVKFWVDIVSGSRPAYVTSVYHQLLSDSSMDPTIVNWASLVRDL